MTKPVSIGPLPIGENPWVVGVISSEHTLAHLAGLDPRPFDIAELRVDLIGVDSEGWISRARGIEDSGAPVIVTVRHKREGGHWYRDESERADVYHTALPHVSAMDVEIHSDLLEPLARESAALGKTLIGSFHDFSRTPSDVELDAAVHRGFRGGAAIVKLAVFINVERDIARLENLLERFPGCPLSLLGMGPLGSDTRVSLALAGSCLTYGFVDESTAPGQLSAAALRERLAQGHAGYRDVSRTRS
jgi:3-dehydroquinate dehydratase-1